MLSCFTMTEGLSTRIGALAEGYPSELFALVWLRARVHRFLGESSR